MDDDDYSYYDSLSGGRPLPLSGNPPADSPATSYQGWNSQYGNNGNMNGPMTFAATPPDFRAVRSPSSSRRNTRSSDPTEPLVESYWIQNHPVMKKVEWNTVRAQLPVVAPSTEQVRVKNTIFNALTNKLEQCEGDWTDKSELFASLFTDYIVPAAKMQATFAITDMDSYSTDVFTFNDMELLDSNFRVLETGHPNAADYPPATRT
jgi:hypothetical protein